jgi:hypothetical protein
VAAILYVLFRDVLWGDPHTGVCIVRWDADMKIEWQIDEHKVKINRLDFGYIDADGKSKRRWKSVWRDLRNTNQSTDLELQFGQKKSKDILQKFGDFSGIWRNLTPPSFQFWRKFNGLNFIFTKFAASSVRVSPDLRECHEYSDYFSSCSKEIWKFGKIIEYFSCLPMKIKRFIINC